MGRPGGRPPGLPGPCRCWRPGAWLKVTVITTTAVAASATTAAASTTSASSSATTATTTLASTGGAGLQSPAASGVDRPYDPELPPLVLIPPFTGSVLRASVDESSVANPLCGLALSDQLWPPAKSHLALLECWSEQMQVSIDPAATRAGGKEVSKGLEGVKVRTVPAGRPDEEPLVPGIFEPVLWQMQRLGYRRGKNLFSAPFDWRRGPGHWAQHSWPRLKSSVERWVRDHGGKPAIFLSLSMGSPYFVAFLLHHPGIDAAWKQRHVAGFVSLSGPFAGTASALSFLLWGKLWPGADDREGVRTYDRLLTPEATAVLKPLMDGWGSIAWLLPRPSSPASRGEPIVELPPAWGGNVTAEMLPEMLARFSPSAAELYALGRRYPTLEHPGVKVHCFFGTGAKAPRRFAYLGDGTAEPAEGARARAELAARVAMAEAKRRGVEVGNWKFQNQLVGLAGQFADLVAPSTTTASPLPEFSPARAAAGPPPGAALGSREWLTAAGELLGARVPEETVATEGDGLIERSSLEVCERWRGRPGLPDAEVRHMDGVTHAQESHDDEQLFYVRQAVARLAGLANATADSGVSCAVRAAQCPQVQDRGLCFELALRRQLRPEHDCCQEAAASHACMGMRCVAKMLGGFVAANPTSDYVIEGWREGCTNAEYPSRARVQKFAEEARSSFDEFFRTAVGKGDCLAKLPGQGCPAMPGKRMQRCNQLAVGGSLQPRSACCKMVERVLDCMGEHCFADHVAAHSYEGGLAVAGGLVPLVRAWREQCANPRIPVEAVQSLVNRTETAVERLAPLGAAAAGQVLEGLLGGASRGGHGGHGAAEQVLEGLFGGSSHGGRSGHSGPAPGADKEEKPGERGREKQGEIELEEDRSAASSLRRPDQTEAHARAALGKGRVGSASAADGAASPRHPLLAALAAAVAVAVVALALAARRRQRAGSARGPALLRETPLEEGGRPAMGLPPAADATARDGPQDGEEAYRPLSTPRV